MVTIEVECQVDFAKLENIISSAVQSALNHQSADGDINVLVVDDASIWAMNKEYRNVDRPTDVLSFPTNEGCEIITMPDGFLGDIVISFERALAQAQEYNHSIERELAFLSIHGTLHLLGYDHMIADEETKMITIQTQILDSMGLKR